VKLNKGKAQLGFNKREGGNNHGRGDIKIVKGGGRGGGGRVPLYFWVNEIEAWEKTGKWRTMQKGMERKLSQGGLGTIKTSMEKKSVWSSQPSRRILGELQGR